MMTEPHRWVEDNFYIHVSRYRRDQATEAFLIGQSVVSIRSRPQRYLLLSIDSITSLRTFLMGINECRRLIQSQARSAVNGARDSVFRAKLGSKS